MFISSNYAQIICQDCKSVTHIEPGIEFDMIDLKCSCSNYETMETEELRKIAKSMKIHSASQMGREKLLERLNEV